MPSAGSPNLASRRPTWWRSCSATPPSPAAWRFVSPKGNGFSPSSGPATACTTPPPLIEQIELVRTAVQEPVARLIPAGLHEFLDRVQLDLAQLAAGIGTAFFRDWRPLAAGQRQQQS